MSDISPEMAFLQSMQADQSASQPVDDVAEESNEDSSDDSSSSDEDEDADADDAEEEEEEDEDYDPSALVTPAENTKNDSIPTQNGTSQSVRAKGGFLADDSDEEEEASTDGLSGAGTAHTAIASEAQRSITATPLNDVQISKTEVNSSTSASTSQPTNPSLNLVAPVTASLGASPTPVPNSTNARAPTQSSTSISTMPKVRLPNDTVGILEDRITEDARGDIDAWLELISEHRAKNRLDDARAVYERYFKLFPTAADQWVDYVQMELENEQFTKVEAIFTRMLMILPSLKLWSTYLDYVRRRNNLISDTTGKARQVIAQTYEFLLDRIGIDKDAGSIWKDYIQFIRSGPGTPGGTSWQDQQKMDSLRKVYRQAIVIPTAELENIWRDYFTFETQLNAVTGRKFIQEQSPGYYTAKQCVVQLFNITKGLRRDSTPKLPPLLGFDGDEDYENQVNLWKSWIAWELDDPLVLKGDDIALYRKRILHVYKQATISLPFEPYFYSEAFQFCLINDLSEEGTTFLEYGIQANPESCLLAYKHADRIESTTVKEDGQDALIRRGEQVRAPYNKVLDALYGLIQANKKREEMSIARIQENFAQRMTDIALTADENEEEQQASQKQLKEAQDLQIKAIQAGCEAQVALLKKTISFTWVALMRAMRRIQGKGKIGDAVGGMRQIFNEARKRGQLTGDVYIASSLLEHNCYRDPAAAKIFERGFKLYPEDENLTLEYLKHLIDIGDSTNARAIFETSVNRFAQNPANLYKAKPLYIFFHHYEANYGELSQVVKLERRMRELFPSDNFDLFANRYRETTQQIQPFDPTSVRPIISIRAQSRPKALPSIEQPAPIPQEQLHSSPAPFSPRPPNALLGVTEQQPRASPKRALIPDEDLAPPRKVARGESPLFKGAAGRRVNANKTATSATPLLPRDVTFFLSILPRAEQSNRIPIVNTSGLMTLLRHVNLTQAQHNPQTMQRVGSAQGYQPSAQYGYMPR